MKQIQINLSRFKQNSYPILINPGLLSKIGLIISRCSSGRRKLSERQQVCIITDRNVARFYLTKAVRSLKQAGFSVRSIICPAGESQKSLRTVQKIYQQLLKYRFDRSATLIALGGGVIGDLTGFIAATYLRGINFIQMPTTLLAQVDAAIGGKTAVNLPEGKNLIGAFHQPRAVLIDPLVLKTLPQRQFKNGFAEIIKAAVIKDARLFQILEKSALPLALPVLIAIIARTVLIKARLVEKDEREERGLRTVLNYGHTVGHALEALGGFRRYQHGEAVSLGMTGAAQLAGRMNLVNPDFIKRQTALLQKYGLPTELPAGLKPDLIIKKLNYDKKIRYQKLRWVLPTGIGRVVVSDNVPVSFVKEVLLHKTAPLPKILS
ncbi:MAG: 3-dehydroquinate synthase [Planctomycetota bacterium]